MPEAVDVGSVLGGRYKVTAYVLASAEKDLVLDGVDQVLNRSVSILVASAGNASQVATSARELATGDRSGNIQVLDLGITEAGTYLVTNRAPAADMLDLIVQQDAPAQEAPYVEPFFTDTLGSEIFGRPRSMEPETYEDDDDQYDEYDDEQPHRKSRLSGLTRRFGRQRSDQERQDDTSDLPPVVASPVAEPRRTPHLVPPPPSRKPSGPPAGQPSGRDGGPEQDDARPLRAAAAAGAAGAGAAGAASAMASQQPERAASRFPLSGHQSASVGTQHPDGHGRNDDDGYGDDYDDTDTGGRRFSRVLVGVVLTIVLVVAVVLAATQLGKISGGTDLAGGGTEQATSEPAPEESVAPPTPSAEPTPEAVPPVVTGITRLVPDNQALDAANDVNLPLIIDGNPATFWGNQVYASDTFGGLATNLALVVELEQQSAVSRVTIDQLNGAGGGFSVLVNDQPTLDGAVQIAQGSFTAPTVTLPIPAGTDGPASGRYVIVNITRLPRLSNIQAQYPFGLRIAEIRIE
ncbi:ABC transporter substrate-binding protein [Arthrobacter sp. NamB2]|uniref:ABC transporter substrate-binding protein n=1 Tax=Arthrobacter sp. NamB2 TaxID=2576035 RepID=UPI0010C99B01|nr:ABC transporter substrate-binding protein [Arthrobacter sp. NamB2]TKV29004.1 ABC transporter substrate-binding protein [Arthrobacter sp. NamB2]